MDLAGETAYCEAPQEAAFRSTPRSLLSAAPWLVILAIVAASVDSFADPDLWRHILVGRIILHTGHIPLRDSFSYTALGHPWRQHEWLADTILALGYDALGVLGLRLVKFACAAATIALLALGMGATGAPMRAQRPMLILIALGLAPQMQFRPQLFTFVMTALLMALMAAESYRKEEKLWIAIPALALWANLHGGFVVGLAMLVLYSAVVAGEELWRGAALERGRRLGIVSAAGALATLLNPFGIGVWLNAMHSITDRYVRAAIVEWQPLIRMVALDARSLSPEVVPYLVPLALFVAFAIAVAIAPAGDDIAIVAVAVMLVLGAFDALRNTALGVIAVAIPLTRHAGLIARDRGAAQDADIERGFHPMLAAALALALIYGGGVFSERLAPKIASPAGAVAFMRAHRLEGNVLCDFTWGGYVMWHLGPASKVFIDARWELVYPHRVMRDFVRFDEDAPGAEAVLRGYPHDFVLVPPGSPGYRVVARDPGWKIIYRDPIAVLFARASSAIARSASTPVVGAAAVQLFP